MPFSIYLIANDSIIGPVLQSIGGNDKESKGWLGEITSSQQGDRIAKVNFLFSFLLNKVLIWQCQKHVK